MREIELRGDADGVEDAVVAYVRSIGAVFSAPSAARAVPEEHAEQTVVLNAPGWRRVVIDAPEEAAAGFAR